DRDGLLERFDKFLAIAAKHGISVMPVLFDDCGFSATGASDQVNPHAGKQADPIPGVHNSRWVPSPGPAMVRDRSTYGRLEVYVKGMIGRFAKDERILLWDLYNEPGNSGLGDESYLLVEASFGWAREVGPTQPLTVGTAGAQVVSPGGKIDTRRLELSDVNTFHTYGPRKAMAHDIAHFKRLGRPVLCTEWMARTLGSNWAADLPLLKDEKVGCYNWGLVKGRTQTHYPWSNKPWTKEPAVWFCDLFHADGTPYDENEIKVIGTLTGQARSASSKVGGVPVAKVLERLGAKLELGSEVKDLDRYSTHFDRTDPNRDGKHTKEEFVDKGRYMTPRARAGIFRAADGNADGVVTKAEYVLNRIITDEAKAIVQAMDDDEDGLVKRAEFVKHAAKLLADHELAEQVYNAFDANADGAIIIPEYLRVWGQWARAGRQPAERRIAARRAKLAECP
ncbi:hypothetical protein LCGC14_2645580, partial [marine sediment metagenome]